MMSKSKIFCLLIFLITMGDLFSDIPIFSANIIFQYTQKDKSFYRIPGISQTNKGTIMLVCQRRVGEMKDFQVQTNLELALSRDDGISWNTRELVYIKDTVVMVGSIIYDGVIDRMFITYTVCPLEMSSEWTDRWTKDLGPWFIYSDDEGETWSKPELMSVKLPSGKSAVTSGNGVHGIQLDSGRLISPAWVIAENSDTATSKIKNDICAGLLLSDDHGQTWYVGAYEKALYSNEPSVAKTFNGDILMLWRNQDPKNHPGRGWSLSKDNGEAFSETGFYPNISYTEVHSGVAAYKQDDVQCILQSSPDGPHRHNIAIRISDNNGKNFQKTKVISPGPGAYSDLFVTKDNTILCVYEGNWYKSLTVCRLNYDWLVQK